MARILLFIAFYALFGCFNSREPKAVENQLIELDTSRIIKQIPIKMILLDTPINKGGYLVVETPIEQKIEKDTIFRAYLKKEILQSPKNRNFAQQMGKLQKIKQIYLDSSCVIFKDFVAGKEVYLRLKLKPFKASAHKIKYYKHDGYRDCELIDGKSPWGGYYACNAINEVDDALFSINGKEILIASEFKNLYRLHFNESYPLLLTDEKADFFYLYIDGGNAAGAYTAKFVMDNNAVRTRIVLNIIDIAMIMSY